jgi:MFS family permease
MSRDLILVAISMFTWGVGEGMFLYFQPIYLQQLGADPLSIGTILGGFGLMMTISHVPAGYLADRLGRRPIMLAAWVMGVVATWIMALANDLPFFVAGLLLYGVTLFVISPLNSYVTAARGRFSVGRALTLMSASFNLGVVIGPWLGGQIGEQMGLRQTYTIAAWIFMASTVIIFLIRSQPVETASMAQAGNGWIFNSRYLAYFAIVFLAMFATYLPQPLSPNFLQNQRALSLSQIGRLYSVSSIGVVALNLALGQLPVRAGFLLGQVSVGLFALLLWRGTGLPWYTLGYFMLGGYKTARSLAAAQMRELVHQAKMGLAYGLTETVSSTATMLSPPLAGYLYDRNPVWIYALAVGLVLVSIVIGARFLPAFGAGKIDLSPSRISSADPLPAAALDNYETPEQ